MALLLNLSNYFLNSLAPTLHLGTLGRLLYVPHRIRVRFTVILFEMVLAPLLTISEG